MGRQLQSEGMLGCLLQHAFDNLHGGKESLMYSQLCTATIYLFKK